MPPALSVARRRCMLVRRRSSPAPAGRSEILRCRGDLATRNHHERGTAWAHPSIRDTGPDGRRLRGQKRRFGDVRVTFAVGTRVTSRPPHIYGPAARCKRINWMGHAVRFNLSDLWLEHALRAIMEIRAQMSSLDPRPRGPCAGPDFSCAGETVVPSFSLSLANLGREAPDLLLARSHSHHAAFGVGAASYPRA